MFVRTRYVLTLLLTLAGLPLVSACGDRSQAQPAPPPPPTVGVVTVAPETVTVSSEWITTLDGYVNAQIRPQVSGYLIKRNYQEGTQVRKGEVLFEIDARPIQATLAQANAQLAQAQAELGRTERDVARDTPLAKERAIPQSQMDNDVQANLAAQATVKAAQAAVETAQLNLGFTKVRSLVDGVAAIATAQIGDLVGPTTLLTTVSQMDPIRAYFSLSEQEYLGIAAQLNRTTPVKALWSTGKALTLTLADGSVYEKTGAFLAADRQIDPKTGTIRISAAFPNPRNILRPGQYGRVSADTRVVKNALLVPQRAVSELQGAAQIRIVDADNKVGLRTVTLGTRVGSRFIVAKGIEAGNRVIVDSPGVRPGTVVKAQPFTAPEETRNGAGANGDQTPGSASTGAASTGSAASAGNAPTGAATGPNPTGGPVPANNKAGTRAQPAAAGRGDD
jgi:membrane fusion protein (multidrug efflux system)